MTDEAKVESPWRAALVRLRDSLRQETADLRTSLGKATADLEGNKVWVGPTAAKWGADLKGRHTRVKTLVDKLIPAVEAEIARTPEKVTPGEAKMQRMELQGY